MYALALSLFLVVVVSSASRSCLDFPAITDYKPNKPFSPLKLFLLELFTTAIETNQGHTGKPVMEWALYTQRCVISPESLVDWRVQHSIFSFPHENTSPFDPVLGSRAIPLLCLHSAGELAAVS